MASKQTQKAQQQQQQQQQQPQAQLSKQKAAEAEAEKIKEYIAKQVAVLALIVYQTFSLILWVCFFLSVSIILIAIPMTSMNIVTSSCQSPCSK